MSAKTTDTYDFAHDFDRGTVTLQPVKTEPDNREAALTWIRLIRKRLADHNRVDPR